MMHGESGLGKEATKQGRVWAVSSAHQETEMGGPAGTGIGPQDCWLHAFFSNKNFFLVLKIAGDDCSEEGGTHHGALGLTKPRPLHLKITLGCEPQASSSFFLPAFQHLPSHQPCLCWGTGEVELGCGPGNGLWPCPLITENLTEAPGRGG